VYKRQDFTFSSENARRDWGYEPKYPEEDAVRRSVAHYKAERESGK
jgi:nucleoside-diphosphate-sugar epimerase